MKKQVKKVLDTFWKTLRKKLFFLARAPPQNYYILAQKASLKKILGSVGQK